MKAQILKKLGLALFINLSGIATMAQQVEVKGQVKDDAQRPLDYVTISLLSAKDSSLVKSDLTDAQGNYSFSQIKSGNYLISARMFGMKDAYSAVFSVKEQTIEVPTIVMSMASKALNEVTVTAKRPLLERKLDRLVMNVENSTLSSGSSALEVLEKAPGVTVDQNDNLAMRGKQGVNVMLDGKMTYMSNADVVNMLKNMPSSEIESIELITNPSAKYDASGNAGIINIKRKKGKGLGTNGSASMSLGYSPNYRGNGGININHRTKTVNLFGSYNYNYRESDQNLNINRISGLNSQTYFSQIANIHDKNQNNNFKAGLDIFMNKKNTLGFLVTGYTSDGRNNNVNNTLVGSSFNQSDSSIFVNALAKNTYRNMAYNANYKVTLDSLGQELSADADYSHYYGGDKSDYKNYFFQANGSDLRAPWFFKNANPSKIDISAFKADYVKPLGKDCKLEAGIKTSWVKTDNDFQFTQDQNGNWENDPQRSNHFVYDENVNAAYTNFSSQYKGLQIQVGLRAEQTNSKGNLITTNNVVKRSYINLFPSAFISRSLGKNHDLSASYSRRIDRPSYDALNPFEFYLDQYTFQRGNPFLNPQFTNSYELSYTYKKQYNLSVNYSLTNDVITQVLLPDNAKKALYQTNKNLDKQISYGVNLNTPITFAKWWNSSNNFGLFYLGFKSANLEGQNLNTGKTVFQVNSQHNFTITKTLSAEFSGNYTSPMEYGTLKINAQYSFDGGINQSLMNKKLNLKLAMSDLFNTRKQSISSAYPGLNYDLTQKNDTQVIRLTLSYKFGKNDIKPARRRATGLESEQSRLKN